MLAATRIRVAVVLACAATASGCLSDLDARLPAEHRVVAGGRAEEAPAAMRAYGCSSCHTIPGVPGAHARVGPSLAGFAGRQYIAGRAANTPEALLRWIRNPQAVKPGTAMPNLGVTDADARDIAAYLYTLR